MQLFKSPFSIATVEAFLFSLMILAMSAFNCIAHASDLPLPEHKINATFDLANHRLRATSVISLPAGPGLELQLAELEVTEILVNGQPVVVDGDLLRVPASAAGAGQQIRIEYTKNCPAGSGLNLVDATGIILVDNWHPLADQDMTFALTLEVPAHFAAVSEADEIIISPPFPATSTKQVRFRFSQPLAAIHLAAGPYVVKEEQFSETVTLASYFFAEDQELAEAYRQKARRYLSRYEALVGAYPYRRFAIVENRLPTGFAMPTFTLLGQAVVRLPFITDTSLGHEVLHEWFGNSIRVAEPGGNWSEGLTAYLADHSFAAEAGGGSQYRKEQLIKYASFVAPDNAMPLAAFMGAADDLPIRQAVRAVGYSKGTMVFHMLKNLVGEETFNKGLRDFFDRMKFQRAGWNDLKISFEKAAGRELGAFFSQWLTRADIPEITAEQLQVREAEGRPVLSFTLKQNADPPYQLTIPYEIVTANGSVKKTVTIDQEKTLMEEPLAATPTELIIDGGYDLMRKLGQDEAPPTWSGFEGASQKLAIIAAPEEEQDRYTPFVELLKGMDCRILPEKEVTSQDLAAGPVIFLGSSGRTSRAWFATPAHPRTGVTVDVRQHPLRPESFAVLVTSASAAEAAKVAGKLTHYGKYSFLHFEEGRNTAKQVRETEMGLSFSLAEMPAGVPTQSARPFAAIIDELLKSRVIYVGETHTSYEDHVLQLAIIRALFERDSHLAIGMEMFAKSSQTALDDYIGNRSDEKAFLKDSNYFKQWGFDFRLYRDILSFARRSSIPVIGLNLEKQIASDTFKGNGAGSMDEQEQQGLPAERDLDLPGYRQRLAGIYQQHAAAAPGPGSGPAAEKFSGFLQAQTLWDETMAETVADYLKDHPDTRMVVVAGAGHTDKAMAIPPRVARRIAVDQAVVLNASGSDIDSTVADYLFFSPPQSLPPLPLLGVVLTGNKTGGGAQVQELAPKGQAEAAGIRKDDVIIAIDNEPVAVIDDVKIIMLSKLESKSVQVRITRPHRLLPDEELVIPVALVKPRSPHPD